MAQERHRLWVEVDHAEWRLFKVGAVMQGVSTSTLAGAVIHDWVALNRDTLLKAPADEVAPGQLSVTELQTPPTARRRRARQEEPARRRRTGK